MIGPHKAKKAVDAVSSASSGGTNTHAKKGADTAAATQENLRTEEALGQRNSWVCNLGRNSYSTTDSRDRKRMCDVTSDFLGHLIQLPIYQQKESVCFGPIISPIQAGSIMRKKKAD